MNPSKKLRAKVRSILQPPANYLATVINGDPAAVCRLPQPRWLEIANEEGAYFLFYLDAQMVCFADTWHQTVDEAFETARTGYGVGPDDWVEVGT